VVEVEKSEKITVDVGLVDLEQIDLLVDKGFYANRRSQDAAWALPQASRADDVSVIYTRATLSRPSRP
jgi:hypothetical protein